MQKHAIALGYFFLAAFCIAASSHAHPAIEVPLLWVALAAALAGIGFFISACMVQLRASLNRLVRMFWLAQQPPVHRLEQITNSSDHRPAN